TTGFNSRTLCGSDSAWFTLVNNSVDSVHWNFGDPTSGSANTTTIFNPDHLYTSSGTFSVQLVSFHNGGLSDTITQPVTIQTGITVNLGNDTTLCLGQSYTLNAGNAGATYQWQDNSGNQTLVVNQTGTYWVNVSESGCTGSDTIHMTFSATGALNLGPDTAACAPNTVILDATTAGATYHWQDNSSSPTYTVTQTGYYSVTASLSGCSLIDTVHVSITTLPQAVITADSSTICSNDSVQICAPNGFAIYQWNLGQGTNCIYARLAGNYYVTVTDNNGCTAESNHLPVTVYPLPPVSITVNGDTLTVYNTTSRQWYLNGQAIGGATSPMYIASVSGVYTVVVTDSLGCKAASSPIADTLVAVPNGIANVAGDKIMVYPNPLYEGAWQLEVSNDLVGGTVDILDDNGRLVYQSLITDTKSQIEINAARGIYLMRIYSSKYSFARKLIRM
ncbi:MAG: hypothetical protein JWO06_1994, partial [Bacteroidota bacterium]|nr:hypothetical protein [Bacteroidota bacterium]